MHVTGEQLGYKLLVPDAGTDSSNGTSSLSNASTTPSIKKTDTSHSYHWTEEE
jgi:hypothetical protein